MRHIVVVLMIVSVFFTSAESSSIYDGLVGYWTFENMTDSTGITGPFVPHNVQVFSGKIGNAVSVSGGGYADVVNNDSIQTSHDLTVSFWAKHDTFTFPTGSSMMVDKDGWGGDFSCWLWAMGSDESSYNTVYCMIPDGDWSAPMVGSGTNIQMDEWHFYVFIFQQYSMSFQLDNESPSEYLLAGENPVSDAPLTIGCDYWSHSQCMSGQIDELGIWNRALSPDEINYLYNSGAGRSLY